MTSNSCSISARGRDGDSAAGVDAVAGAGDGLRAGGRVAQAPVHDLAAGGLNAVAAQVLGHEPAEGALVGGGAAGVVVAGGVGGLVVGDRGLVRHLQFGQADAAMGGHVVKHAEQVGGGQRLPGRGSPEREDRARVAAASSHRQGLDVLRRPIERRREEAGQVRQPPAAAFMALLRAPHDTIGGAVCHIGAVVVAPGALEQGDAGIDELRDPAFGVDQPHGPPDAGFPDVEGQHPAVSKPRGVGRRRGENWHGCTLWKKGGPASAWF